jgi:hypothetical protein
MTEQDEQEGMHRRRITLADGRYLIFYTFDEQPAPRAKTQAESENSGRLAPAAEPEAEEERRV